MATLPRYSNTQILLHWLTAPLVILIIALPYFDDFFASFLGGRGGVFTLHKSLGITVLALTLIRILIRIKYGAPALLPPDAIMQQRLAKLGHYLLYTMLLLMPITGLLLNTRPINVFWLFTLQPLPLSEAVHEAAEQVHVTVQYAFIVLIVGHISMALWHYLARRDRVLPGMLPLIKD
ncbi:cytochrome b561 [Pseudomonas duriflava]|uniref:Cytochrome b561 n=1 Tax=Pseudomonas duriflava TaxID=459528 RepID=A0A562QDI3_9PSED|nr:cytochrome b [Pseudomonas duriflava]TWI54794.1 cytochrome b561 [Pseudomonas duriflava]